MPVHQNKVLLFMGAGIGVPLGLPITTGFVNDVQHGAQQVTNFVVAYLGDTGRGRDIEWLLSTLEGFATGVAFTEFLLERISQGSQAKQSIMSYKAQASIEIRRIKKLIFNKLENYNKEESPNLYSKLIGEIRSTFDDSCLSVITTNYDLTFEYAIQHNVQTWRNLGIKDFDYGFKSEFGLYIYDSASSFLWNREIVEFIKVHGSLDWHRDADGRCTRAGNATVPDDPDSMPILYPGYKGVPEIEPFASLHGKFQQRLMEATEVIVVGFAFRDAYVNNTFDTVLRTRPDLNVWCFNPSKASEYAADSRLPYFVRTYANFHHIPAGIELKEQPLNIRSHLEKLRNPDPS